MKRKILIRFDNICSTMDYSQWKRADEILRKYGVKPLLGIIPECKDPDLQIEPEHEDFWEWIKGLEKEGYTLAMHGCYHLYRTNVRGMVNNGYNSEFAGLSFDEQYELICHGKEVLESHEIHTNIFFAPAHSYDENTLKALSKAGFKYVSDGKSKKPYKIYGIKCIPCRSGGCPRIHKTGYYTAVFHAHEWVCQEKEYGFFKLKKLCQKYHSDIVDFHEFSSVPCGNYYMQKINEKFCLLCHRVIFPFLIKLKKKFI